LSAPITARRSTQIVAATKRANDGDKNAADHNAAARIAEDKNACGILVVLMPWHGVDSYLFET